MCTDFQSWRDARASFLLPIINNGDGTTTTSAIKRTSANPTLDADLHLNPPGGMLSGTNRATAFGGWIYFRDLFVRTRGAGYKLNFEAFFPDLMDFDDLASSSAGSGGGASGTTSSDDDLAAKERGLALKSSTLFEVSHLIHNHDRSAFASSNVYGILSDDDYKRIQFFSA